MYIDKLKIIPALIAVALLSLGCETDINQTRIMETNNQIIVISAECQGDNKCRYSDEDIFFTVTLINPSENLVSFPLELLKKTGPHIRLLDQGSNKDYIVPTNLADESLQDELMTIDPKQSVSIEWVLHPQEIDQFKQNGVVDIIAEIEIANDAQVNGIAATIKEKATLRIYN